tara:strand:- start:3490 stop:3681 length:192 start_codon:yes stop_codon:yes gene_type:complete
MARTIKSIEDRAQIKALKNLKNDFIKNIDNTINLLESNIKFEEKCAMEGKVTFDDMEKMLDVE